MSYTSQATINRMKDTLNYATRIKSHRKEGCQTALHEGVVAGHACGKTSGSPVQHHAGHSREHRNSTLRSHIQSLLLSGKSSRCQHRRTFPAMTGRWDFCRKNIALRLEPLNQFETVFNLPWRDMHIIRFLLVHFFQSDCQTLNAVRCLLIPVEFRFVKADSKIRFVMGN